MVFVIRGICGGGGECLLGEYVEEEEEEEEEEAKVTHFWLEVIQGSVSH